MPKKDTASKRNFIMSDRDYDYFKLLGGGNATAGLRVAAMIVRTLDSQHGLLEDTHIRPLGCLFQSNAK
jgi:hypothetical protein